ncbi:unnamed protein product, partial [Ectocarpus sp. 12 AP-2014]
LPLPTLESVRFDVGRGAAVAFAANMRMIRSYGHMQGSVRRSGLTHRSCERDFWCERSTVGSQEGTNGGAMDVHDSASVTLLGDLGLENIEITGSGAGMCISNNVAAGEHITARATSSLGRLPRAFRLTACARLGVAVVVVLVAADLFVVFVVVDRVFVW